MFLIDTNILITAQNEYYPLDFCSGFWEFIKDKNLSKDIGIIKSVENELKEKQDIISQWLQTSNLQILDDTNLAIQEIYKNIVNDIANGVISPYFLQAEINRFLSKADPWLIAAAKHDNYTIVTNEKLVAPNSAKVKIPNVCSYYGVNYTTPFNMLRDLGINLRHV